MKHWDEYIMEDSLPLDSQGRPVPFRQPTDWLKKELPIWANHVIGSFDGSIPVEKRLMFFGEGVRAALPGLKREEDEAEAAEVKNPPKRKKLAKLDKGKGKAKAKARVEGDESDAVESEESEVVDLDNLNEEGVSPRQLRSRTARGSAAPQQEHFDDSDDESAYGETKAVHLPPVRPRGPLASSLPARLAHPASPTLSRRGGRSPSVSNKSRTSTPSKGSLEVFIDKPRYGPPLPPAVHFGPLQPPLPEPQPQYERQVDAAIRDLANADQDAEMLEAEARDPFPNGADLLRKRVNLYGPPQPLGAPHANVPEFPEPVSWTLSDRDFMADLGQNTENPNYDPKTVSVRLWHGAVRPC